MTTRTTLARTFRPAAMLATAFVALTCALGATSAGADVPTPSGPLPGQDERISMWQGTVTFSHHGEVVKAIDKKLDGYGVQARITAHGLFRVSDYYAPDEKPVSKNLSIPEGSKILLRLCLTENHKYLPETCTEPQVGIS